MASSRTLQAARLKMLVNGTAFAAVSEFHYSVDTPVRELMGIDQEQAFELASTTAKVTGSLSVYRLAGDGGAEGRGFSAFNSELARGRYFSITLIDRGTDQVIFSANRCQLQNQSWSVPARGVVTGTLNFVAIDFINEAATSTTQS